MVKQPFSYKNGFIKIDSMKFLFRLIYSLRVVQTLIILLEINVQFLISFKMLAKVYFNLFYQRLNLNFNLSVFLNIAIFKNLKLFKTTRFILTSSYRFDFILNKFSIVIRHFIYSTFTKFVSANRTF